MALAVDIQPDGFLNRKNLPRLQTSFNQSSSRLQRIRPNDIVIDENSPSRIPLNQRTPRLTRQASKGGIFRLFNRSKSTTGQKSDQLHSPEGLLSSTSPATSQHGLTMSTMAHSAPLGARDISNNDVVPSVSTIPPSPGLRTKSSRMGLRSRSHKIPTSPRPRTTWDPPPLFQAYPQAIRHACLQASTLAADAILRTHNHKRNSSMREEMMQSTVDLSSGDPESAAKRKEQRSKSRHRRRMSGSFSNGDWTRKIYVLVTSGYVLQYAGDGTFDRLPEKILQLGKHSVAFASDVIPGKHWVLQISQAHDGGETIATDSSMSFLSKLGFRGADARRTAISFLLVFESAEEMESWMMLVRLEIESLGGKKYRPDIGGRRKTDESTRQIRERPSRTFMIKRDPNQFRLPLEADETRADLRHGSEAGNIGFDQPPADAGSICSSKRYSSIRRSLEAPSIATTVLSSDQLQLDRLREGSRLSYISAGTRTLTTSRGSSPATTPIREEFASSTKSSPGPNTYPKNMAVAAAAAATTDHQRRSTNIGDNGQGTRLSALEVLSSVRQSHAQAAQRSSEALKGSPPNFSIPRSSKRYSSQPLPATCRLPPTTRAQSDPVGVKENIEPSDDRPTSMVGNLPSHADILARSSRPPMMARLDHSPALPSTPAAPPIRKSPSPSRPVSTATTIPRRFSSLEYSKGIIPIPSLSTNLLAPPPISESGGPQRPTSSHSANTKRKLRRPTSMQVRSSPLPVAGTSDKAQSEHKLQRSNVQQVQSRRSMPVLAIGPPPLPPPSCPLPAPPCLASMPERACSDDGMRNVGLRRSVVVE